MHNIRKDNGAVADLGYTDISYTIKRPAEHAILLFSKFSLWSKGQSSTKSLTFLIWKPFAVK